MIETLFFTIAFCLGWAIITSEGNLLYFLRKPFDKLLNRVESIEAINELPDCPNVGLLHLKLLLYLAKPFVLCITCFASIWGIVVFTTLNGFNVTLIPELIINCISASFIQTFIWVKYQKSVNCNECN